MKKIALLLFLVLSLSACGALEKEKYEITKLDGSVITVEYGDCTVLERQSRGSPYLTVYCYTQDEKEELQMKALALREVE